jgi:hypothetical protein
VTNYPVKDKLGDGKDTQMFCIFKGNGRRTVAGDADCGPVPVQRRGVSAVPAVVAIAE